MALKYLAANILTGLSSDTKPTNVPANTLFVETDTRKTFFHAGSGTWNEQVITTTPTDFTNRASPLFIVYQDDTTFKAYNTKTATVVSTNTNATIPIQFALDNLTGLRDHKETVKLRGDFTITKITIPSYVTLDMTDARLFFANASNTAMIENADTTNGNTDIEFIGGLIDGNRAGQTGGSSETASMVRLVKCSHVNIHDGRYIHANYHCFRLNDCPFDVRITNNSIENWEQEGISDQAWFSAIGVCKQHVVANNYFTHSEDAYGGGTVGSCAVASVNVSDFVFANNVVDTIRGGSATTFNGLRQVVANNTVINGAGGSGVVSGTPGSGIVLSQGTTSIFDTSGSIVIGNIVKNMGVFGISVQNGWPSNDLIVANNFVEQVGVSTATAGGIVIQDWDNVIVQGNIVHNAGSNGIYLNGNSSKGKINNGLVAGNICYNNDQGGNSSDALRAGITLHGGAATDVIGVIVQNNKCFDNQGTKTQNYGIRLNNTQNCIVRFNDVRDNSGAGISQGTDSGSLVGGNIGALTANPDTSSGVVATVETELNEVKATLRAVGIIG